MNCLEFRRRLGSEPASTLGSFVAHREECPRCASAHRVAGEFEDRIRGALRIPVPANLADRVILAQTTESRQVFRNRKRSFAALIVAAAASIVVALVSIQRPQAGMPALAGLVVAHLHKHVVNAADAQDQIPMHDVMAAFAARGVTLASVPEGIHYVHECPAGPYKSVHMVMPDHDGPVSVVYVVDKPSTQATDFSHDGMQGREVPLGKGSLVMLARSDADFDAIEEHWKRAMGEAVADVEAIIPGKTESGESFRPMIHRTTIAAP